MPLGFYIIMAAQFFSSLADNALLIAAIALLIDLGAPPALTPMLKSVFTVSYVLFAPFVGAFSDSRPKGRVMLMTNTIKIVGCALMLGHQLWSIPYLPAYAPVLAAYALVGFGAAAYSPAKYGILTEYLPHSQLVIANAWIEGLTVGSIILGTLVGGFLIRKPVAEALLAFDLPGLETVVDSAPEAAITLIAVFYVAAAVFNFFIPDTGAKVLDVGRSPVVLVQEFWRAMGALWGDKLGQIALATTTLFWGAGATLQFIVLRWGEKVLGYNLSDATLLQGVCAVGIAVGAVVAARTIPLKKALDTIPVGIAMGVFVLLMNGVTSFLLAVPVILLVGGLAGFFVVPMNALLQHRGHKLMGAGASIAVQNFNENVAILVMLGLYALLIRAEASIHTVITLFGLFVAGTMVGVRAWYRHNLLQGPMPELPAAAH